VINKQLKLILVSTPIGYLGSGRGGGVELTITSLIKGLILLGHKIILVAPKGSKVEIWGNELYGPRLEERITIPDSSN